MFDFMNICRALADENRVRILMSLRERELCVCQITAFLDLAPSTTSKHLSILRQARLIESAKQGRWVYYRLAGASAQVSVREALDWMQHTLATASVIAEDELRIAELLQTEADSGLVGEPSCFHSPAMHSLAQRFDVPDDIPNAIPGNMPGDMPGDRRSTPEKPTRVPATVKKTTGGRS